LLQRSMKNAFGIAVRLDAGLVGSYAVLVRLDAGLDAAENVLKQMRGVAGMSFWRANNAGRCVAPVMLLVLASACAVAQTCTTQARMQPSVRDELAASALKLATAVQAGDVAALKAATVAEYANDFGPIENVVQNTSDKLKGDTLQATQLYELDASGRAAGDTSDANFSCPLKDTTSETDFSIGSLPPGVYGFAMVEAVGGDHPWLLAFLLRKDGSEWKMAGFYPHAREAGGHNGAWYWASARERVRAKQIWLAWLYYGEADALLRPAGFVTSTQLDKLRTEQHAAAPGELLEGISGQVPLVLKAPDGAVFQLTAMSSEDSNNEVGLHLVLHYAASALVGAEPNRIRNAAVAKALLAAHPDLRQAYSAVIVFADTPGQNPSVLSLPMAEIP